ncbi:hypothetical protein PC121_g6258, partial [Phytophthora cactorum]
MRLPKDLTPVAGMRLPEYLAPVVIVEYVVRMEGKGETELLLVVGRQLTNKKNTAVKRATREKRWGKDEVLFPIKAWKATSLQQLPDGYTAKHAAIAVYSSYISAISTSPPLVPHLRHDRLVYECLVIVAELQRGVTCTSRVVLE